MATHENLQILQEMVRKMTSDELHAAFEILRSEHNIRASQREQAALADWRPGDQVCFTAKGRTVYGVITNLNTKTVGVQSYMAGIPAMKWKVSPSLLQKAGGNVANHHLPQGGK